jgi:hypothetical protein
MDISHLGTLQLTLQTIMLGYSPQVQELIVVGVSAIKKPHLEEASKIFHQVEFNQPHQQIINLSKIPMIISSR